jgi:hypothetical protein
LAMLATTFLEAIKDVAGTSAAPSTLESAPFGFRSALPDDSQLALAGPLRSPYGEQIEVARVQILPPALSTGGEFRLKVDIAGLEGSAYTGEVTAMSSASGAEVGRVDVDVIVP